MQFFEAQSLAPLDGAEGNAETTGYDALRVAGEIGELDGLSLLVWNGMHRLHQGVPLESLGNGLPGVGRRRRRARAGVELGLMAAPFLTPAKQVDRAVACHRQEPAPEGAALGVETLGFAPQRCHDVLHDLFGQPWVAEDTQSDRVGQ